MKSTKWKIVLFTAILTLLTGVLCSCIATPPQTGWMDLPHARSLDKKKGKQLKQLQKNVAHTKQH